MGSILVLSVADLLKDQKAKVAITYSWHCFEIKSNIKNSDYNVQEVDENNLTQSDGILQVN
jgi:hypothetical protein